MYRNEKYKKEIEEVIKTKGNVEHLKLPVMVTMNHLQSNMMNGDLCYLVEHVGNYQFTVKRVDDGNVATLDGNYLAALRKDHMYLSDEFYGDFK